MGQNVDKYDNIMIADWLNTNHIPSLTGRQQRERNIVSTNILSLTGQQNTTYRAFGLSTCKEKK
jgi:hypothetical protein